ncbi:hypothetical protein [Pseudomonas gingeri]|uniref:Uncharacterized protein n=1 Tax=Pseudomonas gingeri TaxID=117681 RepID=A0A7Y7WHI0_9PSED|nr:hypothetical protein [Pseudomonas gingeri]NWB49540.1 hypothetical protein [Pseudomonas gingeri]
MSQLFQVNEVELTSLKNQAEVLYETHITGRDEFLRKHRVGAMERFVTDSLQEGLDLYAKLIKDGYKACGVSSEYVGGAGFQPYLVLTLEKPQKTQKADLKVIMDQVEADYMTELEAKRAEELHRQVELRFQTEQRQVEALRLKQEQEAKERLRAEVLKAWGVDQ